MTGVVAAGPARHHDLPGVYNLRDTGGYRAAAGTTRWGKLLRSDALHRLDEAGSALAGLGVAHVVDLRGSQEREQSPSRLEGAAIAVHHLPVFDDAAPTAQIAGSLGLVEVYDHMVDERGPQLAAALRVIAAAGDEEAVLVHCTAGKDRTGVVVALALVAAGVEREEVVADYAATADRLRGEWAEGMLASLRARGIEPSPTVVELVTASPADVIDALLARLDREHGSVNDYLIAQGLADRELDRLAAALVA